MSPVGDERLVIVGRGAIAIGLAATASTEGELHVLCRDPATVPGAREALATQCQRLDGARADHVVVTGDPACLADATLVVEAIAESLHDKAELLAQLRPQVAEDAILTSTTSSLPIGELARASGCADRFAALHPFKPVVRMRLVELAFPEEAPREVRRRLRAFCERIGKAPVEVPPIPGFVVNRLLFPFLFHAVDLMDAHAMAPEDVDRCMALGAGHPMGPLALLDLIGLDVAQAIARTLELPVPARVAWLVEQGRLGRKTGQGLYAYGEDGMPRRSAG